ncbi:MAG: 3-deoxy-7-phosphoheptulonate synthase [Deltaproteobacteria bacterium]|nr:3-deoxy-7-phosphoheptulonate synthase [Deltaproteobacteria bacterium]
MLILMKSNPSKEQVDGVVAKITQLGYKPHLIPGEHDVAVGITGNETALDPETFIALDGVKECIPVTKPYKLAGRAFKKTDTSFQVGNATFGPGSFVVIAGPCAVESEEQTLRIARAVKAAGAAVLRGGAYKPRSSPYAFRGMGVDGLKILKLASKETGLPVITEALDPESLEKVYEYADIIQLGTRNMQNFSLLDLVGKLDKPVMLKRGMSATIEEWLQAAEYIMSGGNTKVILCERGVRSFDTNTRNMVDLGGVLAVRNLSHLPVCVDPSHGTGKRFMVTPMSRAALALGANAVMIDVHDRPAEALCDGPQAILPDEFAELVKTLRQLAPPLGLKLA